jgi:hypothetical protein
MMRRFQQRRPVVSTSPSTVDADPAALQQYRRIATFVSENWQGELPINRGGRCSGRSGHRPPSPPLGRSACFDQRDAEFPDKTRTGSKIFRSF